MAFQAEQHRPVHSTSSVWGRPLRQENHFIYSTHGPAGISTGPGLILFWRSRAQSAGLNFCCRRG